MRTYRPRFTRFMAASMSPRSLVYPAPQGAGSSERPHCTFVAVVPVIPPLTRRDKLQRLQERTQILLPHRRPGVRPVTVCGLAGRDEDVPAALYPFHGRLDESEVFSLSRAARRGIIGTTALHVRRGRSGDPAANAAG